MRYMDMAMAKMLIAPKLNAELANEWLDQSDSLLWIENTFFNQTEELGDIDWCINSVKGERLAEWVEHELEKILS